MVLLTLIVPEFHRSTITHTPRLVTVSFAHATGIYEPRPQAPISPHFIILRGAGLRTTVQVNAEPLHTFSHARKRDDRYDAAAVRASLMVGVVSGPGILLP